MNTSALDKFLKDHKPNCMLPALSGDFICDCGRDKAVVEWKALQAKLKAYQAAIAAFEFDETTGECLLGCGGDAADGHADDCYYIETLIALGLGDA